MAKSYATLSQIKDKGYLNIAAANTDYDATLLRILENASEDIDHLCQRHFDCLETTMYFDGAARTLIPAEDILSITTLQLDTDGDGTYESTLTVNTDYLLYPIGGPSLWPKTYLKMVLNSSYGSFASGILAGVKMTGVFGHGDGNSATPYSASGAVVNTGGITDSALTHALATGKGALFSAGMTIRIGSEQLYITAVSTDTLTFTRAMNGTTAAAHTAADVIYIYKYPGPVVESALLLATNWWKQRENPTIFRSGNSITGEYEISTDIEKIMASRLNHHIRKKLI